MYVLVSSVGANSKSKVFYTKMKGALDDAVQKLGFPACFILEVRLCGHLRGGFECMPSHRQH